MRIVLAVVLGLLFGGILNVVLQRLPKERSLLGRLHCTRCGQVLTWEALPLVGFVLQRGRCRHCQRPIPRVFPLLEGLTALTFGLLAWRHGWTPLAGMYALVSLAWILTLFLDWLYRYIYYIVIVPATGIALLGALLPVDPRLDLLSSLMGLGVAVAFFGALFFLGQILFRGQPLGLGDVWLAGSIGAVAGVPDVVVALVGGMVLAGVAGGVLLLTRRVSPGETIPYGVYLCLGALGYLCFAAP